MSANRAGVLTVRLSIERLRSLLFELRPATLDREGLVAAIREYVRHTSQETGWTYSIEDELLEEPPPDLRASLYRIAQEAVTNVRKHAAASHVAVLVQHDGVGVARDHVGCDQNADEEHEDHAEEFGQQGSPGIEAISHGVFLS